MTTVAIHQPNYLPWVGYFHKIHKSDIFVFLNHVEYTSGDWIHRNRVKTPDGWSWLSVPVRGSSQPINETEINHGQEWCSDHRQTVRHMYAKADHFDEFFPVLDATYDREWEYLDALNVHLVEAICDHVGLETDFVRSSTLDVEGEDSELLAAICDRLDADVYFSGQGGKEYVDEQDFEEAGIDLRFQSFEHPTYEQRFEGFVPKLSVVDMLLNVGGAETAATVSTL